MFGDIVAIYQGATKMAEYAYDAWGSCTIVSDTNYIGRNNPFRYRGYYWDNDLQLYYLMSRYYDPTTGRFINADSLEYLDPETIGGLNLYAYCGNNPVMGVDPEGHSFLAMLIGAGIGLIVGLASQLVSDIVTNVASNTLDFTQWEFSSWQTYVGAGLGGAIGGAFTPFLGAGGVGFITGFATTAITMGLSNATGDSCYSIGEIIKQSLLIGTISGISAGILDNVKMPGINSGRGSLSAVSKQINTKLIKNSIKNISVKTLAKMTILNAIYAAPFAAINGFIQIDSLQK